jgi:hypothetical protein
MRYLIAIIEIQDMPTHSAEEVAAIDAFNDELIAAGQRLLGIGIDKPSQSILIDNRDGEIKQTQGSIMDAYEYVSGIWIIDVPNIEVALDRAAQGSKACNRRVEVRPILG